MLTTEQLYMAGFNSAFDISLLPEQYQYVSEPYYKGDGQLSVSQLEELVKKFAEYTHQQKIIKGKLMEHILEKRLVDNKIIRLINNEKEDEKIQTT